MAGLLDWLRGEQPEDQQDPMARSVLFGDPEAAGAAQASQAMEPVTGPYLHDVLSGKMADDNMPRSTYDPNLSLAQNTRQPGALDAAMNIAMGVGPGAIRAYHGSPYNFSKFDPSKIGTGEGAQAYGHGLYFAEAEPTAQAYRNALKDSGYLSAGGDILSKGNAHDILAEAAKSAQLATQRGREFALHPDQARTVARNLLDGIDQSGSINKYLKDYDLPAGQFGVAYQVAAQKAKELGLRANPGRMYEVNLHADPEQFLNWDKPLGAQPGVLQRAPSIPIPEGQMADAIGSEYYKRLQNNLQAEEMKRQLANVDVWPPLGFNSPAMASSALRDAGVPGIRYLDQGSRGAGDGTHNYAVFNPDIIEILRKYGLAGMLGGGGAAAAMTGQAQAQEPSVPPQNPYPHPPEDYIEPPPGIWR